MRRPNDLVERDEVVNVHKTLLDRLFSYGSSLYAHHFTAIYLGPK
jgi:hypothetical protein